MALLMPYLRCMVLRLSIWLRWDIFVWLLKIRYMFLLLIVNSLVLEFYLFFPLVWLFVSFYVFFFKFWGQGHVFCRDILQNVDSLQLPGGLFTIARKRLVFMVNNKNYIASGHQGFFKVNRVFDDDKLLGAFSGNCALRWGVLVYHIKNLWTPWIICKFFVSAADVVNVKLGMCKAFGEPHAWCFLLDAFFLFNCQRLYVLIYNLS